MHFVPNSQLMTILTTRHTELDAGVRFYYFGFSSRTFRAKTRRSLLNRRSRCEFQAFENAITSKLTFLQSSDCSFLTSPVRSNDFLYDLFNPPVALCAVVAMTRALVLPALLFSVVYNVYAGVISRSNVTISGPALSPEAFKRAISSPYVFTAFTSASESNLYTYTSTDGLNFSLRKGPAYTPPSGLIRDPSVILHTELVFFIWV
jgi:hypothetical protein